MKFLAASIIAGRNQTFISAILVIVVIIFCVSAAIAQSDSPQNDSVKLFNLGQDAHEKGDFQTAIKFYEQALKNNSEFPEAEYQMGAAFVSLGKTDEAEKAFRTALNLRENWRPPMANLGAILLQKNEFTEAEKFLTKAIELDTEDPQAFVSLAELYLRAKPSAEVLKNFLAKLKNLTAQSKSASSLWASRGAIEFALQDKNSARQSFDKALAINPNDSFALSERAAFFLSENDFSRAAADAKTLVKISPNSVDAKIQLAQIYAKSGSSAAALEILDNLDASNALVLSLKSSILSSSTKDTATLEKQLEKDPKNIDILSNLCELSRVSNPSRALVVCRRASEIEPNNLNHVIAYGSALVYAKQTENAILLFRKILQIAPDNYMAHANLAAALFEINRFAEAKTEYEWLAKMKPDLAIAYYFLGITHDRLEEYAAASDNYHKFLSLVDDKQNKLEIDKVNLRLPSLEKLIKHKGKK